MALPYSTRSFHRERTRGLVLEKRAAPGPQGDVDGSGARARGRQRHRLHRTTGRRIEDLYRRAVEPGGSATTREIEVEPVGCFAFSRVGEIATLVALALQQHVGLAAVVTEVP